MNIARSVSNKPTESKIEIKIEDGMRLCFHLLGGFGDIAMLTPVIRWVKNKYPRVVDKNGKVKKKGVEILLSIPPKWMTAFGKNPYISRVIDGFATIKNADYSLMYDLKFDFGQAVTHNEDSQNMHAVDAYFLWMDKGFDLSKLKPEDRMPEIYVQHRSLAIAKEFWDIHNLDKKLTVGLQLKASSLVRSWLPEYNKELGRILGNHEVNVVLLDDHYLWNFTGNNVYFKEPLSINNSGIADSIAFASLCDIIVSSDSAFIHVAQAFGKPLIGIYGAFNPEYRMGYYDKGIALETNHADHSCSPCYLHEAYCPKGIPAPCMCDIEPVEVIGYVHELANKYCRDKKNLSDDILILNGNYESFVWKSDSLMTPDNGFYSEDPDEAKKIAERVDKAILGHLEELSDFRVADMGCGDGTLLNELQRANRVSYGVDLSTRARYEMQKEYGDDLFNKTKIANICSHAIFQKNSMHVLIYNQILEHLSLHDIVRAINSAYYCLHDVGIMYIYVDKSEKRCIMKELSDLLERNRMKVVEKNDFKNKYEIIARRKIDANTAN